MKTKTFFFFFLLFAFNACINLDPGRQRHGFNCDFNNNGNGLVMASVSQYADNLWLNGDISVNKGTIDVYLKNPKGDTIYFKTFAETQKTVIDTIIVAQPGVWTLAYKSNEGNGKFRMYINY